mmetsp:Transcript_114131/g.369144  ORF Transcript_114131/g.369144 Transcript_114131/m.369144 type:complete len:96 (-) Transcript_114131:190-477(-)
MARARTVALPLLLLAMAAAVVALGLFSETFVGPRGIDSVERSFRAPKVSMQFFGGAGPAKPADPVKKADANLPEITTILFLISLFANYSGFFNPK